MAAKIVVGVDVVVRHLDQEVTHADDDDRTSVMPLLPHITKPPSQVNPGGNPRSVQHAPVQPECH